MREDVRFPYQDGYHIFMSDIKICIIDQILKLASDRDKWYSIFQDKDKKKNDYKRLQTEFNETSNIVLSNFLRQIQVLVNVYDPNWVVQNPVFLRSLKGCRKQVEHQDFSEEYMETADENHFFAGMMFALQDNTYFFVCNKRITMRKGECCIFKGDVFHSGEMFEKNNIRFHCKLGFGDKEPPDIVKDDYIVLGKLQCRYCSKNFFERRKLSRHEYSCSKNTSDRANKYRERERKRQKSRSTAVHQCRNCGFKGTYKQVWTHKKICTATKQTLEPFVNKDGKVTPYATRSANISV